MMNRLYREDTFRVIWCLQMFCKKKDKLLCSLTFLLRCRDINVFTNFTSKAKPTHTEFFPNETGIITGTHPLNMERTGT